MALWPLATLAYDAWLLAAHSLSAGQCWPSPSSFASPALGLTTRAWGRTPWTRFPRGLPADPSQRAGAAASPPHARWEGGGSRQAGLRKCPQVTPKHTRTPTVEVSCWSLFPCSVEFAYFPRMMTMTH